MEFRVRVAAGVMVVLAGVGAQPVASETATVASPVIGGGDALAGAWPDVAAILFPSGSGEAALCTGTLIAPQIVVTAAHCYDPRRTLPTRVLIGATTLAAPNAGETIAIARAYRYPDAETVADLAVLVLAQPSTRTPRALATGWGRAAIKNGAPVAIVGFGAINRDGDEFIDELQEGRSTITDFDCSHAVGCFAAARPAGELGAGGMGIDSCPGDSGGPLYVLTPSGPLLAGVTSRAYDDAVFACSAGGIYTRPDKLIDWIEGATGTRIARGPEPTAEPIAAVPGGTGDTQIDVNDPSSNRHALSIATPPAHGAAKVRSDGALRVCVDPAAAMGADQVVVEIRDTRDSARVVQLAIPIAISEGTPDGPCDLDDFEGGGCCDSGRERSGASAIGLAIGVLAVLRRRRR